MHTAIHTTLHQTFDDKNKNVGAKRANNNQIHNVVVFETVTEVLFPKLFVIYLHAAIVYLMITIRA